MYKLIYNLIYKLIYINILNCAVMKKPRCERLSKINMTCNIRNNCNLATNIFSTYKYYVNKIVC